MNFKVSDIRKKIILENIRMITVDSNEAERSTAIVSEVVTACVAALWEGGISSAQFKAQNIFYSEDSKREFITDFELYANKKLFHIIEAKGSSGLAGAIPQLAIQLKKTGCEFGSATDGYSWQFVKMKNDELIYDDRPLALAVEIDRVFEKIFMGLIDNSKNNQ